MSALDKLAELVKGKPGDPRELRWHCKIQHA